jgi:uncharacterized metal-binding protein
MPSGKTHRIVELALLPGLTAGYVVLLRPSPTELAAFTGTYAFSSLFLSPDLDLQHNDARKRWGPLGFLWVPYAKIFKHRGMSHSLVWGPLTRLLYLTVVFGGIALALVALGLVPPPSFDAPGSKSVSLNGQWLLALGAGLYLPHVLHVLLDRAVSATKRRRRLQSQRS